MEQEQCRSLLRPCLQQSRCTYLFIAQLWIVGERDECEAASSARMSAVNVPLQIQLVIDSLRPGVVSLIRDLNGNHVIQRCLQRLGPDDSQFIYDAAAAHAMEIATHRHGCCVLQRCIDFATPSQKQDLVDQIASNALALSQVATVHVYELGKAQCQERTLNS